VIHDVATGEEVARIPGGSPGDLEAFEFVGESLLNIREWKVVLWDPRKGACKTVYAAEGVRPQSATVAPTGRVMAIGVGGGLILYDLVKKRVRRRLDAGLDTSPYHPVFSAKGRYVLADMIVEAGPYALVVWDTRQGRRWRTIELPNKHFFGAAAFRGETPTVAVGIGGLDLYEPHRGEDPVKSYAVPDSPDAVQFRDGGAKLAVLSYGGTLTLLRTSTGRVLRQVPPPAGHKVDVCKPSPDWSLLAGAAAGGGILIWRSGLD
jgi:hypothetical protein